jgi:hypothetical protein
MDSGWSLLAAALSFMDEELQELIAAGNLCKQSGYMHAAFILGKAGAEAIKAKKKPRRRMIEVRLAEGGKAWIEKGRLSEAVEIED